ncbi:type II toxin-antitoxin system tRNA(fMet)-specific endonuclease VapC [Lonepinella koalarum]|uniref:Ribonuclease VapC n=1 Tax=Lonepinella koalarum TaxID=53417 RepID=A0A4R1KT00_9PAST|nr:tRNA(fMet)-specific endonuclease VapC [Lonepinella koalarum]MDH2927156.1 plasmid maintenance protein [Lonepinella koalarum]TCK68174.1 tRNA(fMet)-specific endonuclease VapC [Lonepinella koalarum]TFJ89434.1 tRNA(fMet)-specific endonuclease VapC [Lonepinella koalarum]
MLKYMLDTNMVIYVIKHRPLEVLNMFNLNIGRMCVSSITVGELYYGAEKSAYPERNLSVIDDFLSRLKVVDYTPKNAAHYGNIKAELSKQGNLIGENDLHIAAHARSEGLILVSNNLREFERVSGLITQNWIKE